MDVLIFSFLVPGLYLYVYCLYKFISFILCYVPVFFSSFSSCYAYFLTMSILFQSFRFTLSHTQAFAIYLGLTLCLSEVLITSECSLKDCPNKGNLFQGAVRRGKDWPDNGQLFIMNRRPSLTYRSLQRDLPCWERLPGYERKRQLFNGGVSFSRLISHGAA